MKGNMPITIELLEELKKSGRLTSRENEGFDLKGRWKFDPPLDITALEDGSRSNEIIIKKGENYQATMWDECNKFAGYLHLNPTAPFWWPMEMFDLKK